MIGYMKLLSSNRIAVSDRHQGAPEGPIGSQSQIGIRVPLRVQ